MRAQTFVPGLLLLAALLTGCSSGTQPVASTEPTQNTTGGQEPASSPDAIEQATAVLGGGYTYEQVQEVTDAALTAGGETLSDSNRSRAWSSVLSTQKGLVEKGYPSPDAMAVMTCIPESISSRNVTLTEAVAYCSLEVAGIPESEW
jgi:hypothetical protein